MNLQVEPFSPALLPRVQEFECGKDLPALFAAQWIFQGKPALQGETRYSHLIMTDLIAKARERGFRELCLFVHKDNVRAIRLYVGLEFRTIGVPDAKGNLRMLKCLD